MRFCAHWSQERCERPQRRASACSGGRARADYYPPHHSLQCAPSPDAVPASRPPRTAVGTRRCPCCPGSIHSPLELKLAQGACGVPSTALAAVSAVSSVSSIASVASALSLVLLATGSIAAPVSVPSQVSAASCSSLPGEVAGSAKSILETSSVSAASLSVNSPELASAPVVCSGKSP